MSDLEIMLHLDENPEKAIEQIINQYSGLIWSVAASHLGNDEDIKEVVNDTWAEFYLSRERFDPQKGSLAAFLSVIAHRVAIKKYRSAEKHSYEPLTDLPLDIWENVDRRLELESYISSLDPTDEKIIRMKYYDGLSAREIAEELDLSYEAVRKRQQRSLKKLWRNIVLGLAVALLAAALAGCAWLILRQLGVVTGYGITQSEDAGIYVLSDEAPADMPDLVIDDAWWHDGILIIDALVRQAPGDEENDILYNAELLGAENAERIAFHSPANRDTEWMPQRMIVRCTLDMSKDSAGLSLRLQDGGTLDFTLTRAENRPASDAGILSMTEGEGGLLCIPRLENGRLIAAIYPVNEGAFVTEPLLNKGVWASRGGETAEITATDESGNVLTGVPLSFSPFSGDSFFEWDFGEAQPGQYTITVPYVYQTLADKSGEHKGELDPADETGMTIALPMAEVQLSGITPSRYDPLYTEEDLKSFDETAKALAEANNEAYGQFTWFELDLDLRSKAESRTLVNTAMMLTSGALDAIVVEAGEISLSIQPVYSQYLTDASGSITGLKVGYAEGSLPLILTNQHSSLGWRWHHSFSFTFEVE
ncbi:MAG: sigma-70 family RNA polymerase sigma factor [Clostridia bacterium]|nr:sigma-70 family RNA polymerase sigma factor [Clostridia bacterium]